MFKKKTKIKKQKLKLFVSSLIKNKMASEIVAFRNAIFGITFFLGIVVLINMFVRCCLDFSNNKINPSSSIANQTKTHTIVIVNNQLNEQNIEDDV